jgi:hypothetical protein
MTSNTDHEAVSTALTTALTGIVPDPASVVEDLNLGRYIDADGLVDTAAVERTAATYQNMAAATEPKAPTPGVPTGARGVPASGQFRAEDARSMSPADVAAAVKAGRFDTALGRP